MNFDLVFHIKWTSEDAEETEGSMTDGESHTESIPEMYSAVERKVALQMEPKMRQKLNQMHHNAVSTAYAN